MAVDGTDLETWGALHGDCTTVELDGEAAETQLMEEAPKKRKAVRKARVLGIARDCRKQYTVDRDARAGHRSATNSRLPGPYVGFELHLAVQARDVQWTDGIERTSLGPEVAGVVTTFSLVPAGTHRGRAIVDELIEANGEGSVEDVVWDPGYSLCRKCPFCSGLLRSRSFPKTMRRCRTAPLVETEAECCCSGILTAVPVELPFRGARSASRERCTTAWHRQGYTRPRQTDRGVFIELDDVGKRR